MVKYSPDLSQISLDRFFHLNRSKRMIPSRVMLLERMEERFSKLSEAGINDLQELIKALGSRQLMESFSVRWDLPYPYLVLLKREARSYRALPKPLSDFPGIPFEYTEVLRSKGIGNTRDYFQIAQEESHREKLGTQTGIPEARLLELFALCDLSRISGVGGTMARICYEAGLRSAMDFAGIQAQYFSNFPEEDIKYCIHYARVIVECELKSEA